jgi:predicted nucleotidyltransferase component of viral defense system
MAHQTRDLTAQQREREDVMLAVLMGLATTPLVLKGGTALSLAYGSPRFSDDLDFDAPVRLRLDNKLKQSLPVGVTLVGVDTLKDTETVTRYRIRYEGGHGFRSLKLEISYRTPAPEEEIDLSRGFRVATLPRILRQKLSAAHDGVDPRTKTRDLYDLAFIAATYPETFDADTAARLAGFCRDPDALVERYETDAEEGELAMSRAELENLVLNLDLSVTEIGTRFETNPRAPF